jgi:hypothetical protein
VQKKGFYMLSQKQKTQALYIKDLIHSAGWKAYEEFIKDFVFEYLNSSLNKDTLSGVKLAVFEAKNLVERYERLK